MKVFRIIIGQVQVIYTPLRMADVILPDGNLGQRAVPIETGPDTIQASAMGVSGSSTIQVVE